MAILIFGLLQNHVVYCSICNVQEHDKYPERDSSTNEICEKHILPPLGRLERSTLADSTSPFELLTADNTTKYHCDKSSKLRCRISSMPDSPVFNTFHIRLDHDERQYEEMNTKIQDFYGRQGPKGEMYDKLRMQPGSLRAVGA